MLDYKPIVTVRQFRGFSCTGEMHSPSTLTLDSITDDFSAIVIFFPFKHGGWCTVVTANNLMLDKLDTQVHKNHCKNHCLVGHKQIKKIATY